VVALRGEWNERERDREREREWGDGSVREGVRNGSVREGGRIGESQKPLAWYSVPVVFNLFVRIPSDVISLQLRTLKVAVYNSSYTQSIIYI
jgi:hypothetical protein